MSDDAINDEETSGSPEETAPVATAEAAAAPERAAQRKSRVGVVVSAKMDKTIVVDVVRRVPHSRFGKIIKRTTRLYVHDEAGSAKEGDKVRVVETRPLSKLKRWRLIEVLAH